MMRDSSRALFIVIEKCFGREGSLFSCFTVLSFQDRGNCPFYNECILNVYIKVYKICVVYINVGS